VRESYPLTKCDDRVSASDADPTRGSRLFSKREGRISTPTRGLRDPHFCYDSETHVQCKIRVVAVTDTYESEAVTST